MSHAKVLFMGTPDFAVPVLESLVDAGYDVVGVLTQPDKPVGRKRVLTAPPVKSAAERLGLPVYQPKRVREPSVLEEIQDLRPDVAVTVAYGQILPQKLLDIPLAGCLNVHASLLPRWRGAAPIQRAIMAGDDTTGVTIMEMVLELDEGPMLAQERVAINQQDDIGTLHDKLSSVGARLLLTVLPDYLAGKVQLTPQPENGVTYANRIVPEDEFISWGQTRQNVYNQIRALSPWPGARTVWKGQVFKVWKTVFHEGLKETHLTPGTVLEQDGNVMVQCGDGLLGLVRVQPAGKRPMAAVDWYRGVQAETFQLGEDGQ